MAYGTEYYARFKDLKSAKTIRVLIQKKDYTGASSEIVTLGTEPLKTVSRGGKDKLHEVVRGSEIVFNFYSLPADSNKYDSIFESAYKDYKIIVQDYTTPASPVNLGTYWLKPDNLSREYIKKLYQISLSAADGLADLKGLRMTSISDGKYSILQVVKQVMGLIGSDLDYRVQLGTWETSEMVSTDCALAEASVDSRRFYKIKNGETEYKYGYDILTEVLKDFNCTIEQIDNYWYIRNKHEANSYVFQFDYATLTQQSRTATDLIVDVDAMDFQRNATLNKIPPLNSLIVTHQNKDVGGDLLTGLETWSVTFGGYATLDFNGESETEGDDDEILRVTPLSDTYDYYFKTDPFNASYINGNEYVRLALNIQAEDISGGYMIANNVRITIKLFNSSGVQQGIDTRVVGMSYNYQEVLSSLSAGFKVPAGGISGYYIEVHFGDWDTGLDLFRVKNVHITSVAVVEGESTDAVVFDKGYLCENTDVDYPNHQEVTTLFGDTEELGHIGGYFVNSGTVNSTEWRRYGKTSADDAPLLYQYAKNVLNNHARFKDFIKATLYDPDSNVTPISIIETGGRYYTIIKYAKSWIRNFIELELVELLTTDTNKTIVQVDLTTIDGVETEEAVNVVSVPPTDHGGLEGLSDDDHSQYYNQARGDARYSQLGHDHDSEYSALGHTHSYDNYNAWVLKTDGTTRLQLASGFALNLIGGSNVSLAYDVGVDYVDVTIGAATGSSYSAGVALGLSGTTFNIEYDSLTLDVNVSNELTVKDGVFAAASHGHSAYAGISESETISGSWNFTTAPTVGGTAISLAGHTHSYDNYNAWVLKTDGTTRLQLASGFALNLIGGSNVSLAYDVGVDYVDVTIGAATGSSYSAGVALGLSGTTFNIEYDSLTLDVNVSNELTVKDGVFAAASHGHSAYAGISESETISGSWNFTTAPTIGGTAISLAGHTHSNYAGISESETISGSWNFSTAPTVGGTAISLAGHTHSGYAALGSSQTITGLWTFSTAPNIQEFNTDRIVVDRTPDTNNEGNGIIMEFTAGETLSAGNVCYVNSLGRMVKADANGSGTYPAMAICLESLTSGYSGEFLMMGVYRNDSFSLTRGAVIYLSTTAGAVTTTAPSASGNQVQVLGRCIDYDYIYFMPSMDYYTVD